MYNIPKSIINRRPLETTVVIILLLLDELSTDDTFLLLLRSSDCCCVDLRCPFSIGLRILLLLLLLLLSFDDFYVTNIAIHMKFYKCVELCELQILSIIHRIMQTPQPIPPSSLILLTEGDVLRRNSGIFLYYNNYACTYDDKSKLVYHMHLKILCNLCCRIA